MTKYDVIPAAPGTMVWEIHILQPRAGDDEPIDEDFVFAIPVPIVAWRINGNAATPVFFGNGPGVHDAAFPLRDGTVYWQMAIYQNLDKVLERAFHNALAEWRGKRSRAALAAARQG